MFTVLNNNLIILLVCKHIVTFWLHTSPEKRSPPHLTQRMNYFDFSCSLFIDSATPPSFIEC